jgi:hypothetical protein
MQGYAVRSISVRSLRVVDDDSVLCGPLDAVDDQGVASSFGRFEFQSKLFLKRCENRRTC